MPQSSPSNCGCSRFFAPPPEQRPRTVFGMPSRWWKNPMGCTARWMKLPPPQVFSFMANGECDPLWHSLPAPVQRLADAALGHDGLRAHEGGREDPVLGVEQAPARAGLRRHHALAVGDRRGERLLAQHVLPRLHGRDRDLRVQEVRHAQVHQPHLGIRDQLAVGRVRARDPVLRLELRPGGLVEVGHRDDAGAGHPGPAVRVELTRELRADDPDRHLTVHAHAPPFGRVVLLVEQHLPLAEDPHGPRGEVEGVAVPARERRPLALLQRAEEPVDAEDFRVAAG